jgi:hypothetical protein
VAEKVPCVWCSDRRCTVATEGWGRDERPVIVTCCLCAPGEPVTGVPLDPYGLLGGRDV